jgi:hypothetical protein
MLARLLTNCTGQPGSPHGAISGCETAGNRYEYPPNTSKLLCALHFVGMISQRKINPKIVTTFLMSAASRTT